MGRNSSRSTPAFPERSCYPASRSARRSSRLRRRNASSSRDGCRRR
jgi:hypothetical protein